MNLLKLLLEALRRYLARRESVKASALPPDDLPLLPAPREVATVPIATDAAVPRAPARPPFVGPLKKIPFGRSEILQTYGRPWLDDTSNRIDRIWERKNLRVAEHLWGAWNGKKSGESRLYMHRLVEPYFREALYRCSDAGVLDYVTKVGCFNPRRMRHDTPEKARAENRRLRDWSRHTWGIAFDINDTANRGVYFNARAPQPWSDAWRAVWPEGVPQALVEAFESVGFRWGGRWRAVDARGRVFVDPMHFELAR